MEMYQTKTKIDSSTMDIEPPSPVKVGKSIENTYVKMSKHDHILKRPDLYVDSVKRSEQMMWVYDPENDKMSFQNITFSPALYKIFDEIIVNAADNKVRDPKMNLLEVEISMTHNFIRIKNNGRSIPIEFHKTEQCYVPELILGHLLTSSNYDDSEQRLTGGRNGLGAKLTNIFSKKFTVECKDARLGKTYYQEFSNNMLHKTDPVIGKCQKNKKNANVNSYTQIIFWPDLKRFQMENFDQDIFSLFSKRVYDIAGIHPSVNVILNNRTLNIESFESYVNMYFPSIESGATQSLDESKILSQLDDDHDTDDMDYSDDVYSPPKKSKSTKTSSKHSKVKVGKSSLIAYKNRIFCRPEERWNICVALSESGEKQVSFVNSINTYFGGTHVTYIEDQIVTAIKAEIQKKHKNLPIKSHHIKSSLWLFIDSQIINPEFNSQCKERLKSAPSEFGSVCKLPDYFIKKLLGSDILANIVQVLQAKSSIILKKGDGVKKIRLAGIPKLDDANKAGSAASRKCTLILTEGDSAKSLAVSGLGVVGRDYYGVFPLKGKLLNVRDASLKSIANNSEIQNLKKIMGLKSNSTYDDEKTFKTLRYGHIMIMTDQDHDGSHIKGLIINFIHRHWPELLRKPGFLQEFITPIVKVSKGKQSQWFYTIPEYEAWKTENQNQRGWKTKYYKGLGTSTGKEAKEYFRDLDRHVINFAYLDDTDGDSIDLAFSKKRIIDRKIWLKTWKPSLFLDQNVETIRYRDFVNKELILFSMADNIRSIPSIVDGMKPGQRKILFSCFKRKLNNEMKVAQLAGYVAQHSAYHHGEASLMSTIIGMAQRFIGSNNINLLSPEGQFGTRLEGGNDAASPRYIFTRLSKLARYIFPEVDDNVLTYLNDDGQSIEPEFYVPIIPMVLVNGADGIGTGYSTSVPNFNPRFLISVLKFILNSDFTDESEYSRILLESKDRLTFATPWYRGFTGEIEAAIPKPKSKSKPKSKPKKKAKSKSKVKNEPGTTILNPESDFDMSTESIDSVQESEDDDWSSTQLMGETDLLDNPPDRIPPHKFIIRGIIEQVDELQFDITELPVGLWTSKFKTHLEQYLALSKTEIDKAKRSKSTFYLSDFTQHHTDDTVHFSLHFHDEDAVAQFKALPGGFRKFLRLTTSKSVNNLILFDPNIRLFKYQTIGDIFIDFFKTRLKYYGKRKMYLLQKWAAEMDEFQQKERFISLFVQDKIKIRNVPRKTIEKQLIKLNFPPEPPTLVFKKSLKQNPTEDESVNSDDDNDDNHNSKTNGSIKQFTYLLSMPISSLTEEKINELKEKVAEKVKLVQDLTKKSDRQLWIADLEHLEEGIDEWEDELEALKQEEKAIESSKKRKPKRKRKKIVKTTKKSLYADEDDDFDVPLSDPDFSDDEYTPTPKRKPSRTRAKRSSSSISFVKSKITSDTLPAMKSAPAYNKTNIDGVTDSIGATSKTTKKPTKRKNSAKSKIKAKSKAKSKSKSVISADEFQDSDQSADSDFEEWQKHVMESAEKKKAQKRKISKPIQFSEQDESENNDDDDYGDPSIFKTDNDEDNVDEDDMILLEYDNKPTTKTSKQTKTKRNKTVSVPPKKAKVKAPHTKTKAKGTKVSKTSRTKRSRVLVDANTSEVSKPTKTKNTRKKPKKNSHSPPPQSSDIFSISDVEDDWNPLANSLF